MAQFSPHSIIANMSGRAARRFFNYLDPSVTTNWGDDAVFAPAKAADCFDALDKDRKAEFFLALAALSRVAAVETNLETLRERLKAHGIPSVPTPTDVTEAYDLAVSALVEHRDAWREAQYFIGADTLRERRWHIFDAIGGDGCSDEDPTDEMLGRLAEAVRHTWGHGSFDLGRTVKFTYALRDGRYEYYVAEVDDYPRDSREWLRGRFVSRLVTPVCGIVLIFDRKRRMLRAGTTVPLVKATSIAENWARVVKGVSLRSVRKHDTMPVLENLVDPDRELLLDPDGCIVSARRTLVKGTPFGKPTRKNTTEDGESDALAGFIEDFARNGLDIEDFEVLQVKVKFVLRGPDGREKNVTATITQKGWTVGNQPTWVYAAIRERLVAWEVVDAAAA